MAVIKQSLLSRSPISSPDLSLLHSPAAFAVPPNMADEAIYYMLSRRIPCLQESKLALITLPRLLMCLSTELQQRDRLLDRQVYLNILNRKEVRATVLYNLHPQDSIILLLAALLRVSNCFRLYIWTCI